MNRPEPCDVEGCNKRPGKGRICSMHRERKRLYGTYAETVLLSPEDRFWRQVRRGGLNDCWLWQGYTSRAGYGAVTTRGSRKPAHRVAYELLVGPIPAGLQLDHLCLTPRCVNPRHLEPVTLDENVRRQGLVNRKSHCLRGHDRTPDNLVQGTQACKTCHRERMRRDAA